MLGQAAALRAEHEDRSQVAALLRALVTRCAPTTHRVELTMGELETAGGALVISAPAAGETIVLEVI